MVVMRRAWHATKLFLLPTLAVAVALVVVGAVVVATVGIGTPVVGLGTGGTVGPVTGPGTLAGDGTTGALLTRGGDDPDQGKP